MTWILAKRWALLDGWWPDDSQRQRLEFLHDRGEQELIVCGTAACAQSRDESSGGQSTYLTAGDAADAD
jgi:hypothetical protein